MGLKCSRASRFEEGERRGGRPCWSSGLCHFCKPCIQTGKGRDGGVFGKDEKCSPEMGGEQALGVSVLLF